MDQLEGNPLRDTADAIAPFFSPDGNWIETTTNRNGATTKFTYDSRGNWIKEEVTVATIDGSATYVTQHTYNSTGDRLSTRNPRGFTTFFTYDPYGNPGREPRVKPSPRSRSGRAEGSLRRRDQGRFTRRSPTLPSAERRSP